MDLNGVPLFSVLSQRMSWLSTRQSVLAQNVANADTPNYTARDIKPMDFESMMAGQNTGTGLTVTNSRHIDIHPQSGGNFEEQDAEGEGGTPGGNVVSIEQEMIKLSDTQIQYQTATNLYQKAVNMFRTALGSKSG
ncbi:MAG TPA: flagellar basal body rod protein FlgB [Micropepsaceae bacterium]|jgi:flagellar basal-body rod protein FlgB|nr:flagellar basal body rod protein FlgB [Micropepsaceae bacterium]